MCSLIEGFTYAKCIIMQQSAVDLKHVTNKSLNMLTSVVGHFRSPKDHTFKTELWFIQKYFHLELCVYILPIKLVSAFQRRGHRNMRKRDFLDKPIHANNPNH